MGLEGSVLSERRRVPYEAASMPNLKVPTPKQSRVPAAGGGWGQHRWPTVGIPSYEL